MFLLYGISGGTDCNAQCIIDVRPFGCVFKYKKKDNSEVKTTMLKKEKNTLYFWTAVLVFDGIYYFFFHKDSSRWNVSNPQTILMISVLIPAFFEILPFVYPREQEKYIFKGFAFYIARLWAISFCIFVICYGYKHHNSALDIKVYLWLPFMIAAILICIKSIIGHIYSGVKADNKDNTTKE